jgi:hypothetical protein
MALPVSSIHQGYKDYSKEKSGLRLFVTTLNAGNLVAQVALHATLFNTLAALTLGREITEETVLNRTIVASLPAATAQAQRENKWLLRYHDGTGKNFQSELPCADLSLLAANSDFIDPAGAEIIAAKLAWAAVVVSPDDASGTVLDSAEFVGRRL